MKITNSRTIGSSSVRHHLWRYGERGMNNVAEVLKEKPHSNTDAFLIVNGVSTKVAKIVRESDEAFCVDRFEGYPKGADIDEDTLWNGMVEELASGSARIPEWLGKLAAEIAEIRKERIRKEKALKKSKSAKLAKTGAEREAQKAEERKKRRENRETKKNGDCPTVKTKGPLHDVIARRMSQNPSAAKTFAHLIVTDVENVPNEDEVREFLKQLDDFANEMILMRRSRTTIRFLEELAHYRVMALLNYPEIDDPMRAVIESVIGKSSKAQTWAENRGETDFTLWALSV